MILHAVSAALNFDEMIYFDLFMKRYILMWYQRPNLLFGDMSRELCADPPVSRTGREFNFPLYDRNQCYGRGAVGREVESGFGI